MHQIDPAQLDKQTRYGFLVSAIVPRPIAFVTTCAASGEPNLAPFSFFNGVSATPPLISISIARRKDAPKDTLANIEATGELVVHPATWGFREAVNLSSADFPPGISEIEACRLATAPAKEVAPPRLADAPLALECVLRHTWTGPEQTTTLVIAEIVWVWAQDGVVDGRGRVELARLDPLGRLGGGAYCTVRDTFKMDRPPKPV